MSDEIGVGPAQRDALLRLKVQVEQLTAAHDRMSLAVGGLLSAITGLLKAQETDAQGGAADAADDAGEPTLADLLATRRAADNPRGHPCRDCGRYYDEHRGGGGDCGGWR